MKNCSGCGKPTLSTYCSDACRISHNQRRRELYESKKSRKKCTVCQRTILKPLSNARIYCSDVCMRTARAMRKRYRYQNQNRYRVQDVFAFCMYLAKQFYPFLLQYHRDDLRATCSLIVLEVSKKGLRLVPAISRLAQRELYQLSRGLGWRRLKSGKWLASQ